MIIVDSAAHALSLTTATLHAELVFAPARSFACAWGMRVGQAKLGLGRGGRGSAKYAYLAPKHNSKYRYI